MGGDLKLPSKVKTRIIDAALNLVSSMKKSTEKNAGYVYYASNASAPQDVRGMIGRSGACELAMYKGRRHKKKEAKQVLETWMKHRRELDKVRMYRHTHYKPLYQNAAYYWLFSHYHIAALANEHGGLMKKKVHDKVLRAMMKTRRKNGTWLGHEAFAEITGTARALMIFGELETGK